MSEDDTVSAGPSASPEATGGRGTTLEHRFGAGLLAALVTHPTATELGAFLEAHTQLRGSAEVANKLASKTLLPASIGLCHWLFSDLDPDEAGHFLARLADGDGLAADDPIAALRNRIVKMRVGGGRVNEAEAMALVIMAWNARRAGVTRSKLQLPRGGLTGENLREPN